MGEFYELHLSRSETQSRMQFSSFGKCAPIKTTYFTISRGDFSLSKAALDDVHAVMDDLQRFIHTLFLCSSCPF